jgi:type IV pilus assembly protein PilV
LKLFLKPDGFTLMEILIALIILSVSLLALAALMGTTAQNTSFGGHITEATTFAQDQLEQLKVTPWASIVNGANTIPGSTGIVYTRTWVVATNPEGSLKTVTITMNWTDQIPHSFNLTSVLYQ